MNVATHPEELAQPAESRTRIIGSMALALLVIISSITSVNLALPEMSLSLGASFTDTTWIADAYTVAIAALVLPFGAIADRFGRKRLMLLGMAIFGAVAFLAATQSSPEGVIFFRTLMGVSAAMVMPGTLATITSTFSEEERARGVATWAGVAGAGAVFGLIASGILLEIWSWVSVFIFTGILAIIAFVVIWIASPETKGHHIKFDWIGSTLTAAGLGLLVFGIIDAGEAGWSDPTALGALFSGIALLAIWVRYSMNTSDPLLDVRVFGNTRFAVGTLAVTSQFLAQFGFMFIAMQYLQLVLGYSPLKSAFAMLPLAVVVMPLSQLVPRLIRHVPERIMIPTGIISLMSGLIVLATMDENSGYMRFAIGLMILGAGVALTATPATTAITEGLPRSRQGTASAINDVTRELGAALGIAVIGSFFTSAYQDSVGSFTAGLNPELAQAVEHAPAAGVKVADMMGPNGEQLRAGVMQAFMDGTTSSLTAVSIYLGVVGVSIFVMLYRYHRGRANG